MIIKNATFITSAARPNQFIVPDKPMIVVSGKSNVGKSSFINMLANQKKLAKTSNTPGRTRLVNYFDFGEFILADLPGYGYAKVSKAEKEKWAKTLNAFFKQREHITYILALVDIRHDPTREDVDMINFLHYNALPFTLIATKADKLGKSQVTNRAKSVANFLKMTEHNIIATSAETRFGKEDVLNKIENVIDLYLNAEPFDDDDFDDDDNDDNDDNTEIVYLND